MQLAYTDGYPQGLPTVTIMKVANLPNEMELLRKLVVGRPVKKLYVIYAARNFITVVTTAGY